MTTMVTRWDGVRVPLRTPMDLQNTVLRAELRRHGIDPDRLALMTLARQDSILLQVHRIQRLRLRGADFEPAKRELANRWRKALRRGGANSHRPGQSVLLLIPKKRGE